MDGQQFETLSRLQPEARLILRTLYQVGETSNVNVLKGLAGIGILFFERCRNAAIHSSDAQELYDRILQVYQMVHIHVCDHKEILSAQIQILEKLEKTLREVSNDLQQLSRGSWLTRLVCGQDDALRRLRQHQSQIKTAMEDFQIQCHISIRQAAAMQVTRLVVEQSQIKEFLDVTFQEITREIKGAVQSRFPMTIPASFDNHRPSPFFFGREQEIEEITEVLSTCPALNIAILGAGGIGKTSLVRQVLHSQKSIDYFKERRYFVSCESANSAETFLTSLANQLGLEGTRLSGQIQRFFRNLKAPALLILDNLESPWDSPSKGEVENQLSALSAVENLSVIVTMRGTERPRGVLWTRPFFPVLQPLDAESARQLFFAENECDKNDSAVGELLAKLDFVPLAISLVGSMAQVEEPKRLLERLSSESIALIDRSDNRESSVELSIQLSLDCYRMKRVPEALGLLSTLSLLPDGVSTTDFDLIFRGFPRAHLALSVLKQTALAQTNTKDGSTVIRILNPIRELMLLKYPSPPMLRYCLEFYSIEFASLSTKVGTPEGKTVIGTLLPQIGNMHSVISSALREFIRSDGLWRDGQPITRTVQAAIHLTRLYRYTSIGSQETIELAIESAQTLVDKKLYADALYAFAQLKRTVFVDTKNAIVLAQEALDSYSLLGEVGSMAECHHLLGLLNSYDEEAAFRHYQLGLNFSILSNNRHCQAKCLANLSEAETYKGHTKKAKELSINAVSIFRELNDATNVGLSTFWLGRIAEQCSSFTIASKYYEEAIAHLDEAGDRRNTTRPLIAFGDILCYQCKFSLAVEQYEGAMKVLEELHEADKVLGSYAMVSKANAYVSLGDTDAAVPLIERAETNFKKYKWDHGLIHVLIARGDVDLQQGRFAGSAKYYMEGLEIGGKHKFKAEIALCNRRLGKIRLVTHELDEAISRTAVALEAYRSLSDICSVANCMLTLADIFLEKGSISSAEACFGGAMHFFQRLSIRRGVADSLLGLGKVGKAKGMEDEARWFIEEAASIYNQSYDTEGGNASRKLLEEMEPDSDTHEDAVFEGPHAPEVCPGFMENSSIDAPPDLIPITPTPETAVRLQACLPG